MNPQMDELKKWINHNIEHYKFLEYVNELTLYENVQYDTFKSVLKRIQEIETKSFNDLVNCTKP